MIDAYPLQWAPGWKRSGAQEYSRFGKFSFEYVRKEVLRELDLLGADNIVISSNLKLRQDGYPYSGQRQPEDTGVAVYFKLDENDQCVPCDKWVKVEDNLWAVAKTINALRGIERWGAKEMVNAAFRGFKALPESVIITPQMARAWYEVLEVSQDASMDVIEAVYKRLLHRVHPDKGGTAEAFTELQTAFKQAKELRS